MRDKQKQNENDLFILSRVIGYLDGYSALSCVDPERIEKLVREYSDRRLLNTWNQIKGDVFQIGKLPASSASVVRMTKIVTITKVLFVLLGIAAVLSWLILIRLRIPTISGPYSVLILFAVLAMIYNIDLVVYFLSTRKLNVEVTAIYEKNAGRLARQRQKVKQIAQQLIDELRQKTKTYGHEPGRYEFTVFNRDYKNISVVRERGSRYQAIVRF